MHSNSAGISITSAVQSGSNIPRSAYRHGNTRYCIYTLFALVELDMSYIRVGTVFKSCSLYLQVQRVLVDGTTQEVSEKIRLPGVVITTNTLTPLALVNDIFCVCISKCQTFGYTYFYAVLDALDFPTLEIVGCPVTYDRQNEVYEVDFQWRVPFAPAALSHIQHLWIATDVLLELGDDDFTFLRIGVFTDTLPVNVT